MTALPPPPAPTPPSGTATTFPPPTRAQLLRGLRAPAIGYAWLLAGAVLTMALIVLAANVGSTGDDTGVESDDTNAVGVILGMPFQLAGSALLGSLHFESEGLGASLFFPPLALTLLFLVMTARTARKGEVIAAAGTRGLLAVSIGLVVALIVTPLTWALAMRTEGVALHTASVSLFFGSWALTALAFYLGSSRAAGAQRPAWIPTDYAAAGRLWVGSVGLWTLVAVPVMMIAAVINEGLWLALVVPFWGGTTALYTYAMGHFGALSLAGESLKVWDFNAVWTTVMILGALALALVTSLAWHLRRDARAESLAQPGSWAVLPATYAAGGLLVWLVPSIVLGGALGVVGGSLTLQPAFWLVFVLAVWGAVVEVASRFIAPSLVTAVPERVVRVLRGPEPVEAADTPDAPVISTYEPKPLTPEERARYKKIGIGVGALAGFAFVAWIAVMIVNDTFYGPEDQARAYLDAVVDADVEKAVKLAPVGTEANDGWLTNDVYKAAENRITGYELGKVSKEDGSVTIDVTLEGLDGDVKTELVMERDGHSAILFDDWKVGDGGLAKAVTLSVPENSSGLTINDIEGGASNGDVWLFPGDYALDAYGDNEWLESSGELVTVAADEDYQYAEAPSAVASEAFQQEVQDQLATYLEKCMAATTLDPDDCPNNTYAGPDVRKVVWKLDSAPTPDFDGFDGTFPADLSYGDSGTATVAYESDESYGFGPRDWTPQTESVDFYFSSIVVTEDGSGGLVVTVEGE